MRLCLLAAVLLAAALAGCSDAKFVPVSGVVTVDGKPYGKAAVSFQPMGDKDNPNPGRGSSAYTDESCKFVLKSDEKDGAVVGKHRVRITTRPDALQGEVGVGSPDGTPANMPRNALPLEWRDPGKEFEVPPGGTDKANFDIKTK